MEESKICTKCNKELTLDMFSFRSDTLKYRNQCRKCSRGYLTTLTERRREYDKLFNLGEKRCGKCGEIKTLDYFHKDKYTRLGFSSNCKQCIRTYNSTEEKKNNAFVRRLKFIYKATDKEIVDFINKNECEICGNEFIKSTEKHFDHDHVSGKYRGALCGSCNKGLGLFKDDVQSLKNSIDYLYKESY